MKKHRILYQDVNNSINIFTKFIINKTKFTYNNYFKLIFYNLKQMMIFNFKLIIKKSQIKISLMKMNFIN